MSTTNELTCFKAYDIRGRVPGELNEDLAYQIGQAYATFLNPKKVAVGHDIRLSSERITAALVEGLVEAGVDVCHLGLCGTEQVYFATFHYELDGGVMVTASHNPADYNGMKCVREDAKPISADTGLQDIAELIRSGKFKQSAAQKGKVTRKEFLEDYVRFVLGMIDPSVLKPLKIVSNSGNGVAGPTLNRLQKSLPFHWVKMHPEPDGHFPHGVPNPLLPENRSETAEMVRKEKAHLGVAWDGDFDRCFFFDENGDFVDGYYLVGLIASHLLKRHPGEKIVHDPRLTWDSIEVVKEAGGIPVQHKSGHAFMKQRMREENALFGGETSAHYYFREFAFCDTGMIPWLVVAEHMSQTGKSLSELVGERKKRFPVSGEINLKVADPKKTLERIQREFGEKALRIDETDGIGLEFSDWRFNLRMSNTEPLVRLNVEARGDRDLLETKTQVLLREIEA